MKFFDLEDFDDSETKDVKSKENNSESVKRSGHSKHRRRKNNEEDSVKSSLISILVSLILVIISVTFAYGFKSILYKLGQKPTPVVSTESTEDEAYSSEKEYLMLDTKFVPTYIMLHDVEPGTMTADFVPGKKDTESVELKNGQVYYAERYGGYQGETYYRISDQLYDVANNLYINADSSKITILKSYTELTGSVAITFVSSSGVRVREWADYDADNVVKSVYVGDTLDVIGKVVTEKDDSLFLLSDGLYITTDTRYLNDNTRVVGAESTQATESGATSTQSDQTNADKTSTATTTEK